MHSDEMAKILRQGIREGVLQPGQVLVQEQLAERFKVSRIPVREALRMLTAEGLLTSKPGGGATVVNLSAVEVAELWDIRLAIEPTLAFPIVENVRPSDLRRWEEFISMMDTQDGDPEKWVKTNYAFHCDMYSIVNKPHTERILHSLFDFTARYAKLYLSEFKKYSSLNDEHRDMLQAIKNRDSQLLSQLIQSHITPLRRTLIERLAPKDDGLDRIKGLSGYIDDSVSK